MKLLSLFLITILMMSFLNSSVFSQADEEEFGLNPNQPFSPGDVIYRFSTAIQHPDAPNPFRVSYIYKATQRDDAIIERIVSPRGTSFNTGLLKPETLNVPLDFDEQGILKASHDTILLIITGSMRVGEEGKYKQKAVIWVKEYKPVR